MTRTSSSVLLIAGALLLTQPVLAHHPLGGLPMETFSHGLLSGIGHPILGFDHLFFILLAGVLASYAGYAVSAPVALIGGVIAGVAINMAGVVLPASEILVAASILLLGSIGVFGKTLTLMPLILLFAGLGVCHGWAFGQTLVLQEMVAPSVLIGYLIGLSVVQWLLAVGSGLAVTRMLGALTAADVRARLACAVATGVGLTFLLENIESMAFGL